MKKVFLLSNSEKSINLIKNLLEDYGFEDVKSAMSLEAAENILKDDEFDLIVINSPLADGTGADLAAEAVSRSMVQVIFISGAEDIPALCTCGVFVIKKPFGVKEFRRTLKSATVAYNRMRMLYDANSRLMRQMEEIKLINRAKAILIKTFGMSEKEAHRYIERQAMDLRKTKRYVAEKILSTYEM